MPSHTLKGLGVDLMLGGDFVGAWVHTALRPCAQKSTGGGFCHRWDPRGFDLCPFGGSSFVGDYIVPEHMVGRRGSYKE